MENKTNKNICGLLLTLNDLLFLVDVSSDVGIFGVLSAKNKKKVTIIFATSLLISFYIIELFISINVIFFLKYYYKIWI